jgi:hypothetical protein
MMKIVNNQAAAAALQRRSPDIGMIGDISEISVYSHPLSEDPLEGKSYDNSATTSSEPKE